MSMIPREIENLYPKLNSSIAGNGLQLRMKLKVLSLIEKISDAAMGLYCLDFFHSRIMSFNYLLSTA